MALHLEYCGESQVPVEVEGLIPSAVCGRTLSEIERWPVFCGNRQLPLAELFQVRGDPSDQQITWSGDLSGVHWIGAGMDGGQMHVEGPAGRHTGSEMTAGTLVVEGDVGDWLGAHLHGGLIVVKGRAGHLVGAAYRGNSRGMTGGTILVYGPAGNEVGHAMRRGIIATGGAGDAVGFGMLAGTILVFGPCGIRPGAEMCRGTLGLFGPEPPPLLPTFRYACCLRPVFLALLVRHLVALGYAAAEARVSPSVHLYHGDLVSLGRGEVLLPGEAVP